MWSLNLEDNSQVSAVGDSSNPSYNPIYVELDSTDTNPAPTAWVKCFLGLPAGNICIRDGGGNTGGAVVAPVGTTAGLWELTAEDPVTHQDPIITNELRLDILNNVDTIFWLRASTTYAEVPVDDRTVALKVTGKVERV